MLRALILSLPLALAAPLAGAETATLTVTGEGRVEVAPDMARITLGLRAREATAEGALAAAAGQARAVLERLGAAGVAAEDLQTVAIRLDPVMVYAENAAPRIEGYEAGTTLAVRVRRLEGLGALLDLAVAGGAAEVGGIVFEVAEPQPLEDRARAEAVADARRRAGVIAQAAGLALGPVVEITEGAATAAPGVPMLRFAEAAGMPVAPGQIAIGATVRIVFALSPP